jgi:hypothetical protein
MKYIIKQSKINTQVNEAFEWFGENAADIIARETNEQPNPQPQQPPAPQTTFKRRETGREWFRRWQQESKPRNY